VNESSSLGAIILPYYNQRNQKIYKKPVNEKIQSKTQETLIEYLPHNKEVAF